MSKIGVIVVIFIFAALASAQIPPSGNVFFGYSYYNTDITGGRNHRNGWEGSVEGRFLPLILGGGLDYKLVRLLAWRFQADYIHSHLFDVSQKQCPGVDGDCAAALIGKRKNRAQLVG